VVAVPGAALDRYFFYCWSLLANRQRLAGAEGFEPPSSVLETDSLAIELTPLSLGEFQTRPLTVRDYFTSRCAVCLRHLRQNLLNSNRSVVVLRFFVVE
jgi:hypothetical protein